MDCRDFKSSDVLLREDGRAKLADVGLSKILSGTSSSNATLGTFANAAPEMLLGQQGTYKVSILHMHTHAMVCMII